MNIIINCLVLLAILQSIATSYQNGDMPLLLAILFGLGVFIISIKLAGEDDEENN